MSKKRNNFYNIFTFVIIVLLIIPQTRKPIQIGINKVFALFISPSVIDSNNVKTLKDYDWTLSTSDKKQHNFDEAKGKVVFINLWATWCPPCIAEVPTMEKLYLDYQDKVEFYFVSDENHIKIEKFMNKKQYSFPTYKLLSNPPEELRSKSIPATYILDKKGRIVMAKKGASNWNSTSVRNLLDTLLVE